MSKWVKLGVMILFALGLSAGWALTATAQAPQVRFGLNATTVVLGQCATLSWDVENVREVYLDGQGVEGHGAREVCPTVTTTYNLRVVTASGEQTHTATLTVISQQATLALSADRTTLNAGECTVLRWQATNAIALIMDNKVVDLAGSTQVCPTRTTTYSFDVISATGSFNRTLTVTVGQAAAPTTTRAATATRAATPTPRPEFNLTLRGLAWQQEPKAFEPATLVLDVNVTGVDAQNAGYTVRIEALEDAPYNPLQYWFDSEDPLTSRYLSRTALQEGDNQIWVSGLRFAETARGTLNVTVTAKEEGPGVRTASLTRILVIGPSMAGNRYCTAAASKLLSDLVQAPGGEPYRLAFTAATFDAQNRLDACGDNAACNATQMSYLLDGYVAAGLEGLAGSPLRTLPAQVRLGLLAETIGGAGADSAACAGWINDTLADPNVLAATGLVQPGTADATPPPVVSAPGGGPLFTFRATPTPSPTPTRPTATPTATSVPATPTATSVPATRRPTARPATATPNVPPGVYVTAIRPVPADPKRNTGIPFVVDFLNTTGETRNYEWKVLVYHPDGKGLGETTRQGLSVPPGTSQVTTLNNWAVRGPGGCIPLYAQAVFRNEHDGWTAFVTPNGGAATVNFSVCPE